MKHNLLLTALLGIGCADAIKDNIKVSLEGNLNVSGESPADYTFQLYGILDNQSAFDPSFCGENVGADCYGRLDVGALTNETSIGGVDVSGNSVTLSDVPVDLAYVLVATGNDSAVNCTTDVMGFDETTKIVNADSAISLSLDASLNVVELPRDISFYCEAPYTEPEAPEPEPEEVPEEGTTDEDGIASPEVAEWTTFQITDKNGSIVYGDASAGPVDADISCGEDFPSVLNIYAEAENTSATEAYIRIQFGNGDDGTFTTVAAPIVNGVVDQAISLTGGFSIVQMDLDENLDGVGESNTISFCEPDEAPAQEILTILTWDKDDTDVDTHIISGTEEVAYYSMSQSWGDLDIDDVNGFGPETFTSTPGTAGLNYEVKVHYYSDHGNGDTNVTMRVVYYDGSTGELCDISATQSMASYEWWSVGMFGPGLSCPQ
ncbi:MAG: hypothetical protein VXZ96_02265 [Myxococcota bacterium]|nr:hypothetical protein [Myxococcota bacterium]